MMGGNAYGNEMYMQQYEGDGWAWAGQSWGTGYEQIQYDCGPWEFQPQGWDAPVPKVGAELLTELRLAELKRLIDRDAKAVKKTAEESGHEAEQDTDAVTADCLSRVQEPIEAQMAPEVDAPIGGEDAEEVTMAPVAAASPPGLEAPLEQCYTVLADFLPENRNYGEMPVRTGEEVFVSGEVSEDWIFGVKREPEADQGWLPASALGLGSLADEVDDEVRGDVPQSEQHPANLRGSGSRRGQRRENNDASVARGSASSTWTCGAAATGRGRSDAVQQRGTVAQPCKGHSVPDDAEQWHQHGQWWSKQRHLKPEAQDAAVNQQKKWTRHAACPADSDEENRLHAGVAGRGTGRGGRGAGRAVRTAERPARERRALTSLLDRLNTPLVAPKPSSSRQ